MMDPPASAPIIVAARPKILFTVPTSARPKPAPRNRNVVDKAPANASPSLYSTINSKMVQAPGRVKNSTRGSATATASGFGSRATVSGSGAGEVAMGHRAMKERKSRVEGRRGSGGVEHGGTRS